MGPGPRGKHTGELASLSARRAHGGAEDSGVIRLEVVAGPGARSRVDHEPVGRSGCPSVCVSVETELPVFRREV